VLRLINLKNRYFDLKTLINGKIPAKRQKKRENASQYPKNGNYKILSERS
jgi:hypothetical protein